MAEYAPLDLPERPQLARNLTHFARALRSAGLPAGPGRVADAVAAVAAAGFTDRRDFYFALEACFTSRPEHRTVFAQVFRLYWRDPRYLEHMMAMLLPAVRGVAEERAAEAAARRAAEALLDGVARDPPALPEADAGGEEIEIDASLTMSAEERLKHLDFEQMTVAEMAAAKRLIARLRLPVAALPTRRLAPHPQGPRPDWRASLRASLRQGGEIARLHRRRPGTRWPNLVALCDISGSMAAYSRALLQFLHAVSNARGQGWAEVHAFTFGTRLTNITRHLRARDVDAALAAAGAEAQDWAGGTRIGDCLAAFNRDWSRRVLSRPALVLIVTDGLDRGDPLHLAAAMERLHLSARRVVWLNPLLRWADFAPRAGGVRAMLPHVDCFRAGHNIAALEGLAAALADTADAGDKPRLMHMLAAGEAQGRGRSR